MIDFLSGAVTLGYLVGAAFFVAFYRKTRDRLFAAFAAAFLLFAVNQGLSYALTVVSEPTSLIYVLRVLGFAIIIWAIVDKNIQKPASQKPGSQKPGSQKPGSQKPFARSQRRER